MGCCDPIGSIAGHITAHEALGTGGIRRDVIANIGTASDYAKQPWFLEDRSLLATESDVLYVRMYDGAAWLWVTVVTAPPTSGGSPW